MPNHFPNSISRPHQPRTYAFRWQNISSRIRLRVVWLSLGTIIVITILTGVGLIVGDYPIPASKAIIALWDRNGSMTSLLIPFVFQIVVAILRNVLCLVRLNLQSLINNPLSPDIIGINSGAAVLAVAILAAGETYSIYHGLHFLELYSRL